MCGVERQPGQPGNGLQEESSGVVYVYVRGMSTSDIAPTQLACHERRMTIRSTRHRGCVTITGKCRREGRLPLHVVLNVVTHLVTRVSVNHVFVCIPRYVNGTLWSISDLKRRQATREKTQTTKRKNTNNETTDDHDPILLLPK